MRENEKLKERRAAPEGVWKDPCEESNKGETEDEKCRTKHKLPQVSTYEFESFESIPYTYSILRTVGVPQ
jgi:hypothetical protein